MTTSDRRLMMCRSPNLGFAGCLQALDAYGAARFWKKDRPVSDTPRPWLRRKKGRSIK